VWQVRDKGSSSGGEIAHPCLALKAGGGRPVEPWSTTLFSFFPLIPPPQQTDNLDMERQEYRGTDDDLRTWYVLCFRRRLLHCVISIGIYI
jgi:hypothetical protein